MSISLPGSFLPRWWDDRCLEHLTLKSKLVFCWNLGRGFRGEGSGAGWGLLGGFGRLHWRLGVSCDEVERLWDWNNRGKMRMSQRWGAGLPWWFGVGWRGHGIFGWVELVLGIRLGLELRLGVGTGWCRVFVVQLGDGLLLRIEVGDLIRFGFGLELGLQRHWVG